MLTLALSYVICLDGEKRSGDRAFSRLLTNGALRGVLVKLCENLFLEFETLLRAVDIRNEEAERILRDFHEKIAKILVDADNEPSYHKKRLR